MRNLTPFDYVAMFIVIALIAFLARVVYLQSHYSEPCEQICAPSGSVVDAFIFDSNVSCICDLTKERVEVP